MMLKEKPELLYYYECIKDHPERQNSIGVTLTFSESAIERFPFVKNKEYYKFIATYRRAFIGDMQEELDKAMQCNNMERFAKSVTQGASGTEYIFVEKPYFSLKDAWYEYIYFPIWKKIFNYFYERRKRKKDKNDYIGEYLENALFNYPKWTNL
jgi:hypothetical protein